LEENGVIAKDAKSALPCTEKPLSAGILAGDPREGFLMFSQRSCPSCRQSRRLAFHTAEFDFLCPKCGHKENMSGGSLAAVALSESKTDVILPILVAILASVVFALFVFWVAFAPISR
jgi:ribosomal protein S27AE